MFSARQAFADALVPDGIYAIRCANNDKYLLDYTDTNVSTRQEHLHLNQLAIISSDEDGYSRISPLEFYTGNLVLDASGGHCQSGDLICRYLDGNRDNQRWKIVQNSDGTFSFLCKGNESLCINLHQGNVSTGRVQLYDWETGGNPGHFSLVEICSSSPANLQVLDGQDFVFSHETLFLTDPQVSYPTLLSKPEDWYEEYSNGLLSGVYYNDGFYRQGDAEIVVLYEEMGISIMSSSMQGLHSRIF